MKVLDRVPILDRDKFPISSVIDIVPRQLFNKGLNILKKEGIDQRGDFHLAEPIYRHSSIFLPEIQKYAYITGVLIRENLEDIIPELEEEQREIAEVDNNKKVKEYIQLSVPKIFVLVSRLPIYPEMQK